MLNHSPFAVRVENVTLAYKNDIILQNISFSVPSGQILAILGSSGCGKSTLLKHIVGLHRPSKGKIWIGETLISSPNLSDRIKAQRQIGVMYQSGALFGSLSLLENVRLPLDEFTSLPLQAKNSIAWSKLALVGLENRAHHLPSEISGGMIKRAAIARALALDPAVLFLDEPSAGLDPVTSASLDELILRINSSLGITFVIVTHELPSIFSIANHVIMLDRSSKSIIASGNPHQLLQNPPNEIVRRFFHRQPDPLA
ncbi:MAG: ATP-binding cassette domain-containing protein [Chthoniobacterales bacterium]|nr:ATP-binding cassette domain-containing protein [Chthoniobacterales bacterium]